MLIDKFLSSEKGLAEPDTIFNHPDENHDHNDPSHRHAECLKPYNPKTARKSIGRGPAFKLSLGSKTKISPATTEQQQYQQQQQTQEMFSRESAAASKMYGNPGVDPMTDEDLEDPTGGMLPGLTSDYGANISSTGNGPKVNNSVTASRINTGLSTPYGNGPVSDGKRQGSSMVKTTTGRPTQTWKAGKPNADLLPAESKSISKEVPTKTWKAVRFSSTISRGSNTTTSILVSKSVQTVSTAYKLRLNRWPVWGDSVDDQYYNGRPEVKKGYYYPLWLRRILSFIFSQFGIVLFLTSWISGHAALFQHLEQQPDVKLVNDVVASRNELVITLATELRQVFPYEMAWRRKIDDYFIKFEATLNNATARGYSTNRRAFYKWEYLDFLLFSFQLVTGQGDFPPFCLVFLSIWQISLCTKRKHKRGLMKPRLMST
jgi:hypothetical protein